MQDQKVKREISHLINWYFGNFCAKCGKIDLKSEKYGRNCYEKLITIKNNLEINEMTHKEFVNIIRHTHFCHPFTRKFAECKICKKFGINNQYWIRGWNGWNLSSK